MHEDCVRCTMALRKRMLCPEHGIANENAITSLTLKDIKILEVESQHSAAPSLVCRALKSVRAEVVLSTPVAGTG